MSERLHAMLAQALVRIATSKAFWVAVWFLLSCSATGVWYAARTYYVTIAGQEELRQLRIDHNNLDKRVIRLEVKASISSTDPNRGTAITVMGDL